MKHIYLHWNPGSNGTVRGYKDISKGDYKHCKFGTIYIKEIPQDFALITPLLLTGGMDTKVLEYGETKLDYEDRMKYSKLQGRSNCHLECKHKDVTVESISIYSGITRIFCTTSKYKFHFMVEYNHTTKKYFVQGL